MKTRKIKFRGKDRKGWAYGRFAGEVGKECIIYTDEGEFRIVDCNTVGQFTGLKDRHRKEIYEGDIVIMNKENLYVVKWLDEYGGFAFEDKDNAIPALEAFTFLCEVIGNIHDNPELWRVQK